MQTEILYARIRPELRQAIFQAATDARRKISAQVEVVIEEWLATQAPPAASARDDGKQGDGGVGTTARPSPA